MDRSRWLLGTVGPNWLIRRVHQLERLLEAVALASSREARELYRLSRLALLQPATTSLLGPSMHLVDGPSFLGQYRMIFRDELYRFPARRPDPRILDCGANIGLATIYWKRLYPEARITAFEADPTVFAALSWNCAQFGVEDVELVEKAVWTSDGEMPFWSQGNLGGRLQEIPPSTSANTVRTTSLRPYLDAPVDLLKLDIEGAEVDVLLDCRDRLGQVERIFVEYHSFAGRPQRLADMLGTLESGGFRVHLLPEIVGSQPFLERPDNLGMDLQLNIFAFRDYEPGGRSTAN